MIKYKTLRGLAGYLVRQEGKMTAKKSRAKIGDAMQILVALCDLVFEQNKDTLSGDANEFTNKIELPTNAVNLLLREGAKRWKRAQKFNKKCRK